MGVIPLEGTSGTRFLDGILLEVTSGTLLLGITLLAVTSAMVIGCHLVGGGLR